MVELKSRLEVEYINLKNRVFKTAFSYRFNRQDAEDILHDVIVSILEEQIPFEEWGKTINRKIGLARNERTRVRRREIDTL